MSEKTTPQSWLALSQAEQEAKCQDLTPYEEWDVFKAVEAAFVSEFGTQPGIEKIHCGLAACLGPFNCIVVRIIKGAPRTTLPKKFLGFPVEKEYQRK